MISAPWYLLAAGILILIIGSFAAALRPSGGQPPAIDRKMRDEDIARRLNAQESVGMPNLIVSFGILLILISVAWRVLRMLL